MTISMYKASAPIFVQFLTSLSAVLDKAAAHAEAKKIEPAVLLNSRLYPDMFPLVRQVREATSHGKRRCAPSAPKCSHRAVVSEPLDQFIMRKGGINECAARFTRALGRGALRRTAD
jgi:hypothetical protein